MPFSINAQTQEDIQRANASTIEDISRNVAGLAVQNLGPGQSQVSVRGVSAGQIVRDQPGVKERVGVYLDESVISLSLFTPDFDLFDLNRVETLRGPQGTLFGSGSVGGTVRYITNQPTTDKMEGQVEANINTVDGGSMGGSLKGAVNLPVKPLPDENVREWMNDLSSSNGERAAAAIRGLSAHPEATLKLLRTLSKPPVDESAKRIDVLIVQRLVEGSRTT